MGRLRKSSVLLLSVVLAAAMLPEGVFAETGGSSSAEGSAVTSGIQADASDADAGEMLDKGKYASGQLIVTYDDDMSSRTITKKSIMSSATKAAGLKPSAPRLPLIQSVRTAAARRLS